VLGVAKLSLEVVNFHPPLVVLFLQGIELRLQGLVLVGLIVPLFPQFAQLFRLALQLLIQLLDFLIVFDALQHVARVEAAQFGVLNAA
jgi:hypothetical protein